MVFGYSIRESKRVSRHNRPVFIRTYHASRSIEGHASVHSLIVLTNPLLRGPDSQANRCLYAVGST